jgi:hypothetical protein
VPVPRRKFIASKRIVFAVRYETVLRVCYAQEWLNVVQSPQLIAEPRHVEANNRMD